MSTKRYDYNGLSEVLRVETYPDGKIHDYITAFDLDCDKNDIVTTAVLHMPYDPDLMAYWEPGRMSCAIYGGTYDREKLFSGRVREIMHTGYEIQVTCENIGWKLKQLCPASVLDYLDGKPVKDVVYTLLGMANVKYHVNLDGITDLNKYVYESGGSVAIGGTTVESIPDLNQVIKNMKGSDIDQAVADAKYTKENTEVSREFNNRELYKLTQVVGSSNYYYPSSIRNSWTINNNVNLKTASRITSKNDLENLSEYYVTGIDKKSSAYKSLQKKMKSEAKAKAKAAAKASQESESSGDSSSDVPSSDSTSSETTPAPAPKPKAYSKAYYKQIWEAWYGNATSHSGTGKQAWIDKAYKKQTYYGTPAQNRRRIQRTIESQRYVSGVHL